MIDTVVFKQEFDKQFADLLSIQGTGHLILDRKNHQPLNPENDYLIEIYNRWAKFYYKDTRKVTDNERELLIVAQWAEEVGVALASNVKSTFAAYSEEVAELHSEWQTAKKESLKPKDYGRDGLTYVASGAAIGLLTGIAIAVGVIVTCGIAVPLLLGLVGCAILLAAIGGGVGYKAKTYLDEQDQLREEEEVVTSQAPSRSFVQYCTTALAALSIAGSCFGAPSMPDEDQQNNTSPPMTQVDDDGYDADDSDTESPTKRLGSPS